MIPQNTAFLDVRAVLKLDLREDMKTKPSKHVSYFVFVT